jgi:hypothetical protein
MIEPVRLNKSAAAHHVKTGGLPSHADAGRVAVREFDPRAFESELVCRQSFWDGFATKLKECLAHPFGLRPLW